MYSAEETVAPGLGQLIDQNSLVHIEVSFSADFLEILNPYRAKLD